LVAACALATVNISAKSPARNVPSREQSVTLNQGEVARWPNLAAKTCVLAMRQYPAVNGVCYYPFDVDAKPGRYAIAAIDQRGRKHRALAFVENVERPRVDITLPDDTYVNLSPENARRSLAERKRVLRLFTAKIFPPQFALPLGAPATPLPKYENDFGSMRRFNGQVESEHTGRDYPVNEASPIHAIADGVVVLAEEQFLTGNSVYIDHGDGLISEYFHMSAIAVQAGAQLRRGDVVGKVGATGRASGAHLHLGLRWLGARVDPQPLLEKPLQLHDVGESPMQTERKLERSQVEPKESTKPIPRDDEG
jgi:murein DD-endopeptidase MepM/ murein hydrolase activator NlpD